MSSTALKVFPVSTPYVREADTQLLAADSRYEVRIARNASEVADALRLRHEVFHREMGVASGADDAMDFDQFDLRCKHLIAIERSSGRIVGTYRLNSITETEAIDKLYSYSEFSLEILSESVLRNGIEIGRACVAADHRNSKALFLLWKGLARYITNENKRYIFGCCSIFTRDASVGIRAHRQLMRSGALSGDMFVSARVDIPPMSEDGDTDVEITLPPLFEMYLRLGAKVCGPPIYDAEFGSVDFFVVLDLVKLSDRHRRMFIG